MPRKPVSASRPRALRARSRSTPGALATVAQRGKAASARAAHNKLSPAQITEPFKSPSPGITANESASTPSSAPAVFHAYNAEIERSRRSSPVSRSIAGSVAPMAAVAGRNSRNVATKAIVHCQPADGSAPVTRCTTAASGDHAVATSKAHDPIAISAPTYQRRGSGHFSIRAPSASPPSESPPKNAATTASIAAASCPSHSEHCSVHTIW